MLHHEERHSQQWAREGYTHFLASYAWEQITGGNQTEEDAGLHDGGVQVRRKAGVATLALALLLAVSACDDPDAWHPTAPWAPSLRPAVGLRVEGDELVVWTGTPCTGVTRLDLSFDPGSRDGADLQFVAPAPGIEIETVTPLNTIDGMTATEVLPDGYDWRRADYVSVLVDGQDSYWGGATSGIAPVIEGSPDHPADTFYFDHIGWLDAAGVAAKNGAEFLTLCTPDPAKE